MNLSPPQKNALQWLVKHRVDISLCLVMTVLGILYVLFPSQRDVLKDLYFVPVVISALMLGWEKSSAFTVLGVCLVLCISLSSWNEQTAAEFFRLVIWGCTLGTTSAIIGLIVFTKDRRVLQMLKKQNSLAMTDQLTQIANRRAFDDELRKRVIEFNRYHDVFCVLMVDIDFFKKVNDSYGHNVGDLVLQKIAMAIGCSLRDSDLVARFGGEEFAALLPHTSIGEAAVVAERIRTSVERIDTSEINCPDKVSVSIGIAEYDKSDSPTTLLERADLAMYQAKRMGRNRVAIKELHFESAEVQVIAESTDELVKSVFHEGQSLKQIVDSVAGLIYLEIFENELTRRLYEAARYNTNVCLGLIQLKKDSEVEATKADIRAQISIIARAIDKSLRTSDLVTWYSECEFGVMLPFTMIEDGNAVLQRVFWDINSELYQTGLDAVMQIESVRIIELDGGETSKQAVSRLRSSDPIEISESTFSW